MPISLSFETLVMEGAEKLLPKEVREHLICCDESPADGAPKGVLADLLLEKYQEEEMAALFRWLGREQKWPYKRSWGWSWAHSFETDAPEHSRLPRLVSISDMSDDSSLKLVVGLLRDVREVRSMLPG